MKQARLEQYQADGASGKYKRPKLSYLSFHGEQPLVERLTASEVIARSRVGAVPQHLNLMALDASAQELFQGQGWMYLKTLDASRVGVADEDLFALAASKNVQNLRWLSLAGNAVTEAGVRAICDAIAHGRFELVWLDLRGTKYNATPYLDGGDRELARWRVPLAGLELRRVFGLQRWMTLGHAVEDENRSLIPVKTFRPDRFEKVDALRGG